MGFLQENEYGALLRCHVQPGAKKSELAGPYGDRLKIRVKAPPVEGKANKELLRFLSKLLGRPKSSLSIVRGELSRRKDVFCEGVGASAISERIK